MPKLPKLPAVVKSTMADKPGGPDFQADAVGAPRIITYYHVLSGITTSGEKNGEDGEFERSRQPGQLRCFGDGLEDLAV